MTVKYLLTNGNRELAKDGVFTWTLPALNARLTNGKNHVTCPNAGICAKLCYALAGVCFAFSAGLLVGSLLSGK